MSCFLKGVVELKSVRKYSGVEEDLSSFAFFLYLEGR